jgi:DNA integrity scanning protein DisA with diadenylate cyclase activity
MSAVPSLFIPFDNGRKILATIPKEFSKNYPSVLYSIKKDHSYNLEQPEVLKRKLDQAVCQLEKYKYKLKTSRVISQMRKQKCIELKKLLSKLKKDEKLRKNLAQETPRKV